MCAGAGQQNRKQVYCILNCNSCLWSGLVSKTFCNLFHLNLAERFCNTAGVCRGDLVLSFEEAECFTARYTSEALIVKENFIASLSLVDDVCLLFISVVGGVTSPWRGEYREPRHLSLNKENNPQTSLSPTASPVSETGSDPKLPVKVSCTSPVLPVPSSPEEREEVERTPGNPCKEFPETWDPPPLSSTPLPLKSCSHMERATTISEQELQQLEIGKRHVGNSALCLRV